MTERSTVDFTRSIPVCERIRGDSFLESWHFHREMELVLILSEGAQRLVGNRMSSLERGDLVFLGSNLPHCFCKENPEGEPLEAVLVRFDEVSFRGQWTNEEDMEAIRRLFRRAAHGLEIKGATGRSFGATMERMLTVQGAQRTILLLELLHELSLEKSLVEIVPSTFNAGPEIFDDSRLDRVRSFIQERLSRPIYLAEVARHIGMSESVFRRRFRSLSGRSFPAYLNGLRVERVCRMLIETDMTVTEAAYSCGFDSLANFAIQFQRIQGCSPTTYRQKIRQMTRTTRDPGSITINHHAEKGGYGAILTAR